MDLSATISNGSIMRSLRALRRRKGLKDISGSNLLPSPSSFSSSAASLSSIPNRSVSHMDQLLIWGDKNARTML